MYSCFLQTGQYIIPYHIAPLTGNGQKDRFRAFQKWFVERKATARVASTMTTKGLPRLSLVETTLVIAFLKFSIRLPDYYNALRYSASKVAVTTPVVPPGTIVTPTSEHCDAGKTGAFRSGLSCRGTALTTFELMVATTCKLERTPVLRLMPGCTTSVTSALIRAVENEVPLQYAQALLLGAGYVSSQSVADDSFG